MSKFESYPVVQTFLRKKQAHLSDGSAPVVAGISGGPDSMALLYLLHRHQVECIAVHCNYQLRGAGSDKDQKLVEEICMLWDIECLSVRLDSAEADSENFQAWARDRRYQIFRDIKAEFDAGYIITAHHQDDQLETILQKIMRGAGLSSWKGMDILDGDLFRPLIDVPKREIMRFVDECNVPYRIDSTNEESTYARNFLRHNWFPELTRLFPGWKENMLEVPLRAKEFEAMAGTLLQYISDEPDVINRSQFMELPDMIKPVILHYWICKKSNRDISRGFLGTIESIENLQTGASIMISEDLSLLRDRELFRLIGKNIDRVASVSIPKKKSSEGFESSGFVFRTEPMPEKYLEDILYLDMDCMQFPLVFREWQPSDCFQPLGMIGHQLVSDHLTNRKISATKKKSAKVLETFDGNICAVIFPRKSGVPQAGTIDNKFRCTPSTTKTLTIRKL